MHCNEKPFQKQPFEVFCEKKVFLKMSQISQNTYFQKEPFANDCVPSFLVNHEFDLYLIVIFTSRSTKGKQLGSPRNLVQLIHPINVLFAIKPCIQWKSLKPKEFLITNFVLNVPRAIGL